MTSTETAPSRLSEASDEQAYFKLSREDWDHQVVARFAIDGEPVSKARARFTGTRDRGVRAYTPERTRTAELKVAWAFRQAAGSHVDDGETTYGVTALFFHGTQQRRDVDNMLKLILDGLNKVAWRDDSQVSEVSARRGHDLVDNARTEVLVYLTGRRIYPTATCEHCQTAYRTYPSWKERSARRYCSQQCRHAAVRAKAQAALRTCQHCKDTFAGRADQKFCSIACKSAGGRAQVTCSHCGTEFTKQRCHVRANNYCTGECLNAAARERRTVAARGSCATCGGPTSKASYHQCRSCQRAGAKAPGAPRAVEPTL